MQSKIKELFSNLKQDDTDVPKQTDIAASPPEPKTQKIFKKTLFSSRTSSASSKSEVSIARPLEPIAILNPYPLPESEIREVEIAINTYVELYNKSSDTDEKKAILTSLDNVTRQLEHKYPQKSYAESMDYQIAMAHWFSNLLFQKDSLGVTPTLPTEAKSFPLAKLILFMSPMKVSELLRVLMAGSACDPMALSTLYSAKDSSREAQLYNDFLKSWSLSYLGGSNSKNYIFKSLFDDREFIFKVEDSLSSLKTIDDYCREKLPDLCIPYYVERQAFCNMSEKTPICRSLLVMPYTKGRDLFSESLFQSKQYGLVTFSQNAAHIFEQMAGAFLTIEGVDCVFMDAKLSNWILEPSGKLKIADLKSFLFTERGLYHASLVAKNPPSIITTKEFTPLEVKNPDSKASTLHAFILGANLYCFLAHKFPVYEDMDFNLPVFTGPLGSEMKRIITGLLEPAASRMSIVEACNAFFVMNNPKFEVLIPLYMTKIDRDDSQMDIFILSCHEKIRCMTYAEKTRLLSELTTLNHVLQSANAIVQSLESRLLGEEDYLLKAFIDERRNPLKSLGPKERESSLLEMQQLADSLSESMPHATLLFTKLEALKFGDNDLLMLGFIEELKKGLSASVPQNRGSYVAYIESMVKQLDSQPLNDARKTMHDYRSRMGFFATPEIKALADTIEQAMVLMSIQDRCSFVTPQKNSPLDLALQQASTP